MRSSWPLPEQTSTPHWAVERVLVSYDHEAELVIALVDDRRHLAVAADEADGVVRWLAARLSDTEAESLFLGASDLRSVLEKPSAVVIDVDFDGRAIRSWEIDGSALDDEHLPERGALLPDHLRSKFQPTSESAVELRLDGAAVRGARVPFKAAAAVLGALQRLWTALGRTALGARGAVLQPMAALDLMAISPGSVRFAVGTEEAAFGKIAEVYSELLRAGDEPTTLASMLRERGPRARTAYVNYINELKRNDIEVLARWPGGAAFISPSSASRWHTSLARPVDSDFESTTIEGTFVSFHSNTWSFSFRDLDGENVYTGYFSQAAWSKHASVIVGGAATYTVELFVPLSGSPDDTEISGCILERIVASPDAHRTDRASDRPR